MSLLAAVVSKTVFLVVAACGPNDCGEAVDAESWEGPFSQTECREFVVNGKFDPSDYLELSPEDTHYEVSCSE